jgi:NAD(P)-dependent dehydrogenase (short-subunit alcohol dehydrogenase family)
LTARPSATPAFNAWFRGKCVLITGATSGIGRAAALAFAEAGAKVAFCGLRSDWGREVEAAIAARGGLAKFIPADVRNPSELGRLVDKAEKSFGPIAMALNNAGINHPPHRLGELPVENFTAVLATNLNGVFFAMQAELARMEGRGEGCIINVASVLASRPGGWMAAYAASKAAVASLTRTAAEDYRAAGIRVYSISPHAIATPMFARALSEIGGDPAKYAGGLPADGRGFAPERVAAEILKLACPETAPASGTDLVLDWT